MTNIFINGKKVSLKDTDKLSAGREAEIYKWGQKAVKIYFDSTHPLLKNNPFEQQAADARVDELYERLQQYPNLNDFFVNPLEQGTKSNNKVVAYTMHLLQNTDQFAFYLMKDFVDKGVPWKARRNLISQIYQGVQNAHQNKTILGDGMSPRNFEVQRTQ